MSIFSKLWKEMRDCPDKVNKWCYHTCHDVVMKSCGCTLETAIYGFPSIIKYVYPSIISCPRDFCVTVYSPVWMMLVWGNQQCAGDEVFFLNVDKFGLDLRSFFYLHLLLSGSHHKCCQWSNIQRVAIWVIN